MEHELPIKWKKINVIAQLAIPIGILVATLIYSNASQEKELSAQYLNLAIEILRDPPNEGKEALRDWAISLLQEYSGSVKLSEAAINELRAGGYAAVLYDSNGILLRTKDGRILRAVNDVPISELEDIPIGLLENLPMNSKE